jgi:hypothetical protein
VGPRAGLDRCGKLASPPHPPPGLNPQTAQPVASRYKHKSIVKQKCEVLLAFAVFQKFVFIIGITLHSKYS